MSYEYDVYLKCPKCESMSGDNWDHCEGKCPLSFSPYYDKKTREEYGTVESIKVPR